MKKRFCQRQLLGIAEKVESLDWYLQGECMRTRVYANLSTSMLRAVQTCISICMCTHQNACKLFAAAHLFQCGQSGNAHVRNARPVQLQKTGCLRTAGKPRLGERHVDALASLTLDKME